MRGNERSFLSIPVLSPALGQPDVFDRLMDEVLAGRDVAIVAPDGAVDALLDKAMRSLAIRDSRVFRLAATAAEGLSIGRLVAEVTGRLERTQQDDRVLEEAFSSLTVLDGVCERIVLLISRAEALQRSTLRCLQLAMRTGPALQVVLAGAPGFLAALDTDEFALLHDRLTARAAIPLHPASAPTPLVPAPRPARPGRYGVMAGCGAAVAACIAAGWSLRHDPAPARPQETAARLDPAPAAAALPIQAPDPALAAATAAPALPPLPAVPAVAPPAPRSIDAAPPRSVELAVNGAKTRLEALSAELEAARRQTPRRTAALTRRSSRTAALSEDAPAAPPEPSPRPPAEPQEAGKQERFIGSYTTDANGIRAFRASQQ